MSSSWDRGSIWVNIVRLRRTISGGVLRIKNQKNMKNLELLAWMSTQFRLRIDMMLANFISPSGIWSIWNDTEKISMAPALRMTRSIKEMLPFFLHFLGVRFTCNFYLFLSFCFWGLPSSFVVVNLQSYLQCLCSCCTPKRILLPIPRVQPSH